MASPRQAPHVTWGLHRKRWAIALSLVSAVVMGVMLVSGRMTDICLVAYGVIQLAWLLVWLSGDAMSRNYRRSLPLAAGVVLLPIVCVPLYLVRTRAGKRRAAAIIGFVLSLLTACLVPLLTAGIVGAVAMVRMVMTMGIAGLIPVISG